MMNHETPSGAIHGGPLNVCTMSECRPARDLISEYGRTIDRVRAVAMLWAEQPTDYDEDTEQQIEDGREILRILDGERSVAATPEDRGPSAVRREVLNSPGRPALEIIEAIHAADGVPKHKVSAEIAHLLTRGEITMDGSKRLWF